MAAAEVEAEADGGWEREAVDSTESWMELALASDVWEERRLLWLPLPLPLPLRAEAGGDGARDADGEE